MTGRGLVIVLASAAAATVANISLKVALVRAQHTHGVWPKIQALLMQPIAILGLAMYAIGVLAWFRVLQLEGLSAAYPVLVGTTFVLLTAGSILALGERVSSTQVAGMVLILAGIVVVARN